MPGFWKRVAFACRCFFAILLHGRIPEDVARALAVAAAPARPMPVPAESPDRAVQMLALLQRDGRLIDFLREDIAPYPDEQLGAAVRNIHENCRQVLDRYVKLASILDTAEEQPYTVPAGFDPGQIRLIGNVVGEPPIRGVVRHRGWRVQQIELPSLPAASGRLVVAPAEIEVP